jgi:hypothetical protein
MNTQNQQRTDIEADRVRACLQRVLASKPFANSPTITGLLAFLVEATLSGDGGRLKAYTIGVEVFARPHNFDPEADSLVRVSASRLRAMLAAYYEGEGREDPVRILLRKGRYAPEFVLSPVRARVRRCALGVCWWRWSAYSASAAAPNRIIWRRA